MRLFGNKSTRVARMPLCTMLPYKPYHIQQGVRAKDVKVKALHVGILFGEGTQSSMYNTTWVYKRVFNESLAYKVYNWDGYCSI